MKIKFSFCLVLLSVLLLQPSLAQDPSSWGQAANEYVLAGAKIIVSPDQTISKGELHIKNGLIVGVGSSLTVGPEVRKINLSDSVIHAGFIDPYVVGSRVGLKKKDKDRPTPVSGRHPRVHDDLRVVDTLNLKEHALDRFRKAGFVLVGIAPEGGIFRGQGALYKTAESALDSELLIDSQAYSVLGLEELGWSKLDKENYPLSMMGAVALVRQTILEVDWYRKNRADSDPERERPKFDGNLESLQAVTSGHRRLVCETENYLQTLRMLSLLAEVGNRNSALVLSGEEWKNLTWFKGAAGSSQGFILPLDFPEAPKTSPGTGQDQFTLEILREWFFAPANPKWLKEQGIRFSFTTHRTKDLTKFRKRVYESIEAGLSQDVALAALTTEPARILGISARYGTLEKGKSASFVIRNNGPFSQDSAIREVWIDGERFPDYLALVSDGETKDKDKVKTRPFIADADYSQKPELLPAPFAPGAVLVKNATLWTQEGAAPLKGADLLVVNGSISQVSANAPVPNGAHVINGDGLHVTPGLVDAHSHTAVDGMVNEPGANITAMVRMKDVLDPFDHDIYLQLASGVTAVNILHGSANAIGGQAITCKWKYGSPPDSLVMKGAPAGIKFALGENPKQSNWGDVHATRYPQSRMGVVQLIRGAFTSAKNYRKLKTSGPSPKPDLVLEALLEVLDGKRIVHCHSYRQDEILALIRVAEEVGFKVDVFQHVLEGYKVAEQIKKHGASASTFADWWAYKVEVQDAIPYNTSLMAQAGVLVSVNSDSNDLARRLNTEAAKSIRYGGMSENEAMNMITRNPAQQLGVLDRIGTLSVGKDGDFVIWSGQPLSQDAKVLETWIEGKRYFKRSLEPQRVTDHDKELKRLLALLNSTKKGKKS